MGTQKNRLNETVLLSIQNMLQFRDKKILTFFTLIFFLRPMDTDTNVQQLSSFDTKLFFFFVCVGGGGGGGGIFWFLGVPTLNKPLHFDFHLLPCF